MVVSNIFYFQPENWGRFPFWRAYFSDGLKPPPRWFCKLLVLHSFGLSPRTPVIYFFHFLWFYYIYIFILTWYCWWTKSCTTKDDEYLNIPLFTGFKPSQVVQDFVHQQYHAHDVKWPFFITEFPGLGVAPPAPWPRANPRVPWAWQGPQRGSQWIWLSINSWWFRGW